MNQSDILLGLQSDPFVTSVLIGVVWPLIQAALDRPYWTRERRVWLTITVAVVVTAGVWVSGSYPATWKLIVSQATVFLGVAWTVFQILSRIQIGGVSIIDWAGILTPGGETIADIKDKTDERSQEDSGAVGPTR